MIIWILLSLAFTQIVGGQEVPRQQPKIIRTAPVVVPCLECLKNSGINLASLMRPSASTCAEASSSCDCAEAGSSCGCTEAGSSCDCAEAGSSCGCTEAGSSCDCAEAGYQSEDSGNCLNVVQPYSEAGTADEAECCCCCADSANNNQSNDQGPSSFSVGMLAPLASVLTSFMSGLSRQGDQAVTIDFDGQTCNSNPQDEPPLASPLSNVSPCDDVAGNQSVSTFPSSSLVTVGTPSPIMGNIQSPQQVPAPVTQLAPRAYQCYRKNRKGVSEIEEDSLYAFAQNNAEKRYSCNSNVNHETAFNQDIPRNRYIPNINLHEHHSKMFENTGYQHQSVHKDNNLIQPPTTGNPEFDSISRLSALISSQKSNPNTQSSNHNENLMPCQCCF